MPESRPFVSIERLLVAWLPAQVNGVHVMTDLPHDFQNADGPTHLLPVIAIERISGAELETSPILDRPIVDVDCYAADRGTAQDLAEAVRHALRLLPGQRIDNVVFTRTRTVVGPRLLPHANDAVRRYSANYELLYHTQPSPQP